MQANLGLRLLALATSLFLVSCSGVVPADDDDSSGDDDDSIFDDDDDSSGGPTACDPPLLLGASPTAAVPFSLLSLSGSGGTGDYRYTLTEVPSPSGAAINEITGAYLAGPTSGVTDTIELTDLGCIGSATLEVDVFESMEVLPSEGQVPTGASFSIEVLGGSGSYSCESIQLHSGGSISEACLYTAGSIEGLDGVHLVDTATGESKDSWFTVTENLTLQVEPSKLGLPVGSSYGLNVDGGTGEYEVVASGLSAIYDDGRIEALEAGTTQFTVTDRFTQLTSQLEVEAVSSLSIPVSRAGDLTLNGNVLSAGDVNGDGFGDAIFGWGESDVESSNGGGVSLWYGSATGLGPSVAQSFAGESWEDQAGRGLTVGDFNDDGQVDLAIGIPLMDTSSADEGLVAVHYGLPGEGFSQEADVEMESVSNGDRLGESLAGCDFDGDGIDDLAVGSVRAEDRNQTVIISNQGAVHVYEGSAAGLEDDPDYSLYGKLPSPSGWQPQADLFLGWRMAAGYIDSDEYCDLVVSSWEFNGSDGVVLLYLGSSEGLLDDPVQSWAVGIDRSGSETFGRRLAVGDVNQDGLDDILVGARTYEPAGGSNNGGAFLFLGREFSSDPIPTAVGDASEADWMTQGDSNGDLHGTSLDIGDLDGDGHPDILIGAHQDEVPGSPSNSGTVKVFAGTSGGLPSTAPTYVYEGENNSDYFGHFLAFVGDTDQDGLAEFVVVDRGGDLHGLSAGVPYQVPFDDTIPWRPLDHVGGPAGQWLGWSADFIGDFDSDGYEDIAVGAPKQDLNEASSNSGAVYLYRGQPGGFSANPDWTFEDFYLQSNQDEFGYGVAAAGDFTGDGIGDLLTIARIDGPPSTFSSTYIANPSDCPGSSYGVGRASIFAGLPGGLPADPATIIEPTTVYYGDDDGLFSLAGDFDFNGDGIADFVVGAANDDSPEIPDVAPAMTNNGSVHVVYGRPPDPSGKTLVVCDPDWSFVGLGNQDQLGRSVAGLGDLDGDGCDEFAAGADEADPQGLSNQGAVHIFFGFDEDPSLPCRDAPEMMALVPQDSGARSGWSLDYGPDLDGDGLSELAVGAYNLTVLQDTVGGAWVIPGSYLQSLALTGTEPAEPGAPDMVHPFVTLPGAWRLEGQRDGERAGRSVALVPPYGSRELGGLMMGSPRGADSGLGSSGGARIHLFDPQSSDMGLESLASFSMGGETDKTGSQLGELVRAGVASGSVYAIVGGHQGQGVALDSGSLYVVELGNQAP